MFLSLGTILSAEKPKSAISVWTEQIMEANMQERIERVHQTGSTYVDLQKERRSC